MKTRKLALFGTCLLSLFVTKVKPLTPGDYTVKWAVVCIDSHHTQGSYVFTVGKGG